jgi:superfamily II DNA or RNA helicase
MRIKIVSSTQGDMLDADVVICLTKSLFSRSQAAPALFDRDLLAHHAERSRAQLVKKDGAVRKFASQESYPWSWLASFGLVCVDEAHRSVAATALPCLAMFPCAKIICATATPDRQDQVHDSLGPVFGVASAILQQPYVPLGVVAIETPYEGTLVPVWKWKKKKYGGRLWVDVTAEQVDFEDVNYSAMMRTLETNETRNLMLLESIWDAAIVKQRQTLVLGLLKSHLVALATRLYDRAVALGRTEADSLIAGLMFPETDPALLPRVKSARVIFATFQFASEAFDVGTLSALVLVSPYKSRLV